MDVFSGALKGSATAQRLTAVIQVSCSAQPATTVKSFSPTCEGVFADIPNWAGVFFTGLEAVAALELVKLSAIFQITEDGMRIWLVLRQLRA
jgi:hypothetical protein